VVFGRIQSGETWYLVESNSQLKLGDLITVVGPPAQLPEVIAFLGQRSDAELELDRREMDFRRIFVSNPQVAGRKLKDLDLPEKFGALITRIRRGDIQLIPTGNTVLELGDRV